ncbi:MAG: DNA primase, partial [Pirellulaceae bacterium]
VNPTRQTWKCWVCDLGGDVFSFLMEKERITFPEALQMLADRAGVQLSSPRSGGRSSGSADHKKAMYAAMAWACQQYHHFLLKEPAAESARQYLQQRGISAASIQRFQLGFAPEQWSWLLDLGGQRGLNAEVLEAVGLLVKSEQGKRYDRFRGRVLFPIRDPQGRPIAVGGRVLPGAVDQAKYVNCNETRLYQKSQQLYGLDIAREAIQKQRTAIVMEGYTDVIMAHQHGVSHAVAVCGTALGESHIRLLRRYCDRVVLLLDGDEAGQKRTNEILELFIAAQLDLRVATLPDALDPCDFLMERGEAALSEIVSQAVDALQHKLNLLCQGLDPLVDTHRANVALEQMLELLAKAPRSSLLSDEAARLRQDQILMRLARQFAVDSAALRRRLEDLRRAAQARLRPREQ